MTDSAVKRSPFDYIRAMRPSQWTKNGVVLAAFFFAVLDSSSGIYRDWTALYRVIPAVIVFCLASSSIYIMNDIRDVEADRIHPHKRFRPIAAGKIPIPAGWIFAALLLCCCIGGSLLLTMRLTAVIASYIVLQIFYSFGLKKVALVDIFMIAGGFVLRAIAGAVVLTNVVISPWLLLCTFLLALFLALCKRRHEKVVINDMPEKPSRVSLGKYDERLLDQLIAIVSSATIVSYAMYTLSDVTCRKFGTSMLGFTIPFVAFGIFRYLDLVYRHEKGDRPEKVLLTDIPIIVNILFYAATVVTVVLLGQKAA